MLRRDLEAAGIPYETDSGTADFHALRHSYVTALAMSNAPVKIVQSLARHSTPTLTLGVYAHVGLYDQSAALDALPDLTRPAPTPQTLAKTGTDGPLATTTVRSDRPGRAGCREFRSGRPDPSGTLVPFGAVRGRFGSGSVVF